MSPRTGNPHPLHGRPPAAFTGRPCGIPDVGVAHFGPRLLGPYAASKAALEVLVRTYAAETATTNVRVQFVRAGAYADACTKVRSQRVDPLTLPTPEEVAKAILPLCLPSFTESGKLLRLSRPQAEVVSTSGLADRLYAPISACVSRGLCRDCLFLAQRRGEWACPEDRRSRAKSSTDTACKRRARHRR